MTRSMKHMLAALTMTLAVLAGACGDDNSSEAGMANAETAESNGDESSAASSEAAGTDAEATTEGGAGTDTAGSDGDDVASETIDGEPVRYVAPPEPEQQEAVAVLEAEEEAEQTTADLTEEQVAELEPIEVAVIAAPSCGGLAEEVATAYQSGLDLLATAGRDDVDAIDEAYESFGTGGRLIQVRADELGCTSKEVGAAICAGVATLEPGGQAAEDLVARLESSC